ncbi:MAG: cell division protein SepF [Nesterenkonia sp.]|uniref:cell division protein SepF n=1 Tax=Nesterenkonia marinintestina TaxID=2979865 RepID=UPI0021BF8616|nr:cell division protein SepF [Nesterenkonia sp. GX14115]MDO5493678.1 cell division protein SepF [Nesterenkonia sp.]
MAGAFKKTMIYLGLADGDDYEQERFSSSDERRSAPARPSAETPRSASAEPARSASPQSTGAVARSSGAARTSASRGRTGEVVALDGGQAGASESGGFNSSNLAVDPDYRAPVTPIKRAPSSRDESSSMRKITTVHPRSYNDAKIIGEAFRDSIPVIMNVTDMGESEAKRLVDFSAGLVFGLGGSIERVTNKVFLLSPKNVEVLAEERSPAEHGAAAQVFNQS